MVRSFLFSATYSIIITALMLSVLSVSVAQVRTSSNYSLESDSINIGGGLSSSTNFIQESTVGEVATGISSSTDFVLRAGYQQMQEVFLSLTPPDDVVMDTAIGGLTGGTSNGSTSFSVITDSPAGYVVTLFAEDNPAMQRTEGSETIADYPASATPDFTFNVGGSDAYFGYTVEGANIADNFKDNGSLCNVGSGDTVNSCWRSLSVGQVEVAREAGSNHPAGVTTAVKFRVGIGSSAGVVAGTYVATSTLTALPL